jgi:hypothetical protein
MVGAAKRYYRDNPVMKAKMSAVLDELHAEFGLRSRVASLFGGWYVLRKIRAEEKRLAEGWTYEPPTFYERNVYCQDNPSAALCQCAAPVAAPVDSVPAPACRKPVVADKEEVLAR